MILLIEPDSIWQTIMRRHLGAGLVAADNSSSALDIAYKELPDAVILELNLPDMPGLELLKIFRSNGSFAWLPILVLTHAAAKSDYEASLEHGVWDYLLKSEVSLPHIIAKTGNFLRAHQINF